MNTYAIRTIKEMTEKQISRIISNRGFDIVDTWQGNPVTFWITTSATVKDLELIDCVESAVETTN